MKEDFLAVFIENPEQARILRTLVFNEEEREAELATNEADIEGSLTGGGGGTTLQLSPEEAKDIPFNMQMPSTSRSPHQALRAGTGHAAPVLGKPQQAQQRSVNDIGRNDPCPCGSGKKYKKCHGRQ